MRILRALGALLPLALAAASLLLTPIPSVAQEPAVALTLKAQTPFTTLEKPRSRSLSGPATSVRKRSVISWSGSSSAGAIRSRVEYESSLVDGPVGTLIYVDTFAQEGELKPGETREFTVSVDLSEVDGVSDVDSLVYPARVDLRSAGTQVAALDTPLVHLVREPGGADRARVVGGVRCPDRVRPAGRLADPAFEAAIAPEGGLARQVDTLRRRRIDRRRRRRGARRRADGDRPAGPYGRRVRTGIGRGRATRPATGHARRDAAGPPRRPRGRARRATRHHPVRRTPAPVARIGWARARSRSATDAG